MKIFYVIAMMLALMGTSLFSVAQVSPKIYASSPTVFNNMAKRTLAVELLEEDEKHVEKLTKKKKTDELKAYRKFITDYNTAIKSAVSKHFKLNEKVEYKTESEIEELRDSKSNDYALLYYNELQDRADFDGYRSGLAVPVLVYSRSERAKRMPDTQVYIPFSFTRNGGDISEGDLALALKMMQSHITYMKKEGKVKHYTDYAKDKVKESCQPLKSKTLLVDKAYLADKTTAADVKDTYAHKVEVTDDNRVMDAAINGAENAAILVVVPYGIAKGSLGPISSAALAYFKAVVDANTGEILNENIPAPTGSFIDDKVRKVDFKKLSCK